MFILLRKVTVWRRNDSVATNRAESLTDQYLVENRGDGRPDAGSPPGATGSEWARVSN